MIAVILIDRVRQRNLVDADSARQIVEACAQIERDRDIRCAIVTGAGSRHFCNGGGPDLDAASPSGSPRLVDAVAGLSIPVIAAINGNAMGLGLELMLACDIRIASAEATFGFPAITDGFLPHDGGTQRLPRLIGKGRALELLLTGRTVDASEALEIGLVDELSPPAQVMSRVEQLAGQIAHKAPLAVRYAKEAIRSALDLPLDQGLRLEGDLYLLLRTTADRAVTPCRPRRATGA